MNFKKVNTLSGWIVFAIAYIVYLLTIEPTSSLWDCGEFLAAAYKLEVVHSPGAPLFLLIGRMFSLFAPSPLHVAVFINSMSALTSALTILFLFWTITHFARILLQSKAEAQDKSVLPAIIGAGLVGALAYTFSDTFWFSAVEGEVYAMSSFFTAVVFWAILKWEHIADAPHADRWLVLIFYLMGLSIGVHLLNLLTIPAIIMVYYFRRGTVSVKGSILAFLIGCAILGFVQFGIIQYIPMLAAKLEVLFVNSFGLPFSSGALSFFVLLAALFTWLLIWAKRRGKYLLHLGLLCTVFVIIGYSSYVSLLLRSKADVPIDMGNPDNVMSLIPYLQRDQYGSQPLISGPDFDSRLIEITDGRPTYADVQRNGKDYYELVDHKPEYKFDKNRFFPRIWDFNDQGHVRFYRNYLGLVEGESPSGLDNQKFFWGYQLNWMYWRYFMWNFSGRQNDMQGQGESRQGNWITGIKPVDKMLGRGDLDQLPESLRNNKARNQYYMLPFLLGLAGLFYQLKRDKKNTLVVGLLFFFTGIAIVLYLNNTPMQPRERDYAYAGSFYAFAIWIGLGVLLVREWLARLVKNRLSAATLATLICLLAVPVLMASENWDDHDRSEKTIARDHALNMLNSCDSNAILITYGDNDTYPLWYLQEIEGYRTDVRVINYNLLGTDWQNEQLNYKVNKADALPVIWKPEDYLGRKLTYIPVIEDPRLSKDTYYSIIEVIKFFTSEENRQRLRNGEETNYMPTTKLSIPLDRNALLRSGLIRDTLHTQVPDALRFTFDKGTITRPEMALMNILAGQAQTGWTRPIYIAGNPPFLGLEEYLLGEGVLRKFVPVHQQAVIQGITKMWDIDRNLDLALNTYQFGAANGDQVYYDEKNRLLFLLYRQHAAELAYTLAITGRKEDAKKVLDHFSKQVSRASLPVTINLYDRSVLLFLEACYHADDRERAYELGSAIEKSVIDEVRYFRTLSSGLQQGTNALFPQQNLGMLNYMVQLAGRFGDQKAAEQWSATLKAYALPGM